MQSKEATSTGISSSHTTELTKMQISPLVNKAKSNGYVVDRSVSHNSSESSPSSASTPEPSAPPLQEAKTILNATVKGIKTVAMESYDGLKEWVSSPKTSSPSRKIENKKGKGAKPTSLDIKKQQESREALLQDLMSPFMACHIGSYENIVEFENRQTGSDFKDDTMEELQKFKDRIFLFSDNDTETVLSIDTRAEDEAMQLQRLTSWGTTETFDNLSAAMSLSMTNSMTEGDSAIQLTDDDGHVIPPEIVEQVQKRIEKRRRTRVVRFDYPPIKSLRECPRHNPDDLPNLFFTEEELDEIEADRFSTVTADDIEIVAVGNVKSTSFDKAPNSSNPKKGEENNGSQLSPPTPPLKRKPRSSSPHPSRPAKGTYNRSKTNARDNDPRLIKGVQIYLRERSTGKGR